MEGILCFTELVEDEGKTGKKGWEDGRGWEGDRRVFGSRATQQTSIPQVTVR